MKLKTTYLLSLLIFSFSSCTFKAKEPVITGTWRLSDIVEIKKTTDDAFTAAAKLKESVKDGAVLCFFEDGKYSHAAGSGQFEMGEWKVSQESVHFIDPNRRSDPIPFKMENNPNGKQLLSLSIKERNVNMIFVKESEPLPEFSDDPFYVSNNLWRVKPKQPEDSVLLIKRLSNYLKHLALILKAAKERKQTIVSFEFSQGPVKIYNGGIGVHPYHIVPENWKRCFYDPSDASTAYLLYENYLRATHYKGAGTGDWFVDDYNILLSIYTGINRISKNTK